MTTLKMENKPKNENKLNTHRLFTNVPKDTLAESQATMRLIIISKAENEDIPKNRP
jgi:hypothetical protein